jgi:hypothetical protein
MLHTTINEKPQNVNMIYNKLFHDTTYMGKIFKYIPTVFSIVATKLEREEGTEVNILALYEMFEIKRRERKHE